MRGRRNLQHLPRLDLVRIAEHVLVCVEDVHVRIRVAERLLGDLAQRVAGLDRLRTIALRCRL